MTDRLDTEPRLWFDWTDHDSTSTAVIEAVCEVSDDDVTGMAPLYDVVDPDALDRLFSKPDDDAMPRSLEFSYNGHQVAVEASGDGWVA